MGLKTNTFLLAAVVLCAQTHVALAAGGPDYSGIATRMANDMPVTKQQMRIISEYATEGAPGMSYDDKIDLGVSLSRYGNDAAGRAVMQRIHDDMASPENAIADERLVFNIPGRDPYIEDQPDTVVDMRGLAERCVIKSVGYSPKGVSELNPVESAILEYSGARTINTNIKALGPLKAYAGGHEICKGHGDKRTCTPLATFQYDRMAFPTEAGVQSAEWMHIYLRHRVPTAHKRCDNRGTCQTYYSYTDESPDQWADLQCPIKKL